MLHDRARDVYLTPSLTHILPRAERQRSTNSARCDFDRVPSLVVSKSQKRT
jgi:hypothetical protein